MTMQFVLWGLSTLAGAFVGSYLAGYLKRKGENLATREDIDNLVSQVTAVTTVTKEIEAKISSEVWDRQKEWELKREVLFDAAKQLSVLSNSLLSVHTFWCQRNKEKKDEEHWIRLEHDCVTRWQETIKAYEQTESLVLVTCSRETMMAFAQLGDLVRRVVSETVSDNLRSYPDSAEERKKRFAEARASIRKELGVGFKLAPQLRNSSSAGSQG